MNRVLAVVALATLCAGGCAGARTSGDAQTAELVAHNRSELAACKSLAASLATKPGVADVQEVTVGQMRSMLSQLAPRRRDPWPSQSSEANATLCVLDYPASAASAPLQPIPSCSPGLHPAAVSWYQSRTTYVLTSAGAYRLGLRGPVHQSGLTPCLH